MSLNQAYEELAELRVTMEDSIENGNFVPGLGDYLLDLVDAIAEFLEDARDEFDEAPPVECTACGASL